ncbi:unnamed protein product [Dibothriocephalus latus]|uniref:P-type ATPase C-terminal domain-containing protein n=1 Tax=Dibothriocephalus latus TaxID=60516 RepID=A0A3P7LRF3_DIBLA|nr:unnamed protein product [Dibothriocephalus latus]
MLSLAIAPSRLIFQAFSALPPFAIGLFDRVCSEAYCLKYPTVYSGVQEAYPFNFKAFLRWIFNAVFHSLVLFAIPAAAFHTAIWGSMISWFLFLAIYPEVYPTLPLAAEMVGMVSICIFSHRICFAVKMIVF